MKKTKLDLDFFLNLPNDFTKNPPHVIVRVINTLGLPKMDIALPDRDLSLRRGDVLTMEENIADILMRKGIVEIIPMEENTHDMAKYREESMANVEG